MPSILIHGTSENSQRAERIACAIACVSSLRYAKKVLVLPMTLKYNLIDILVGQKIKQNAIKSKGYSFDDSGVDALLRRFEQGSLTDETFSDCCKNLSFADNSFDLAPNSKRLDLSDYISKNEAFLKRFVQEANKIYELVIILADASEVNALATLQNIADKEVTVISQGNKLDISARNDSLYVINNYDASSIFNFRKLKTIYSLPNEKRLLPVSYNIRFKDACRSESAIDFFMANVVPDEADDNYLFIQNIANIINVLFGNEEAIVEEKKFVHKERPQKKGKVS